MSILDETLPLPSGLQIPKLGFGTWQIPNGTVAYDSVTAALECGYRHIDTARAYGNEASVGRAIRDSGLPRDALFVTTKLPAEIKSRQGALDSFERTMGALALDYVDLYLIHAPWPWSDMGGDYTAGNRDVWTAMEAIHVDGRSRAIGVSNFSVQDMTAILEIAAVAPHANQIKFFIGDTRDDVVRFCRANNILVEGYSPLATGAILGNPAIGDVARRNGRSAAQVCIRYVLQRGLVALPKSTHRERIAANADVDFEISAADMAQLDALTGTRARQR